MRTMFLVALAFVRVSTYSHADYYRDHHPQTRNRNHRFHSSTPNTKEPELPSIGRTSFRTGVCDSLIDISQCLNTTDRGQNCGWCCDANYADAYCFSGEPTSLCFKYVQRGGASCNDKAEVHKAKLEGSIRSMAFVAAGTHARTHNNARHVSCTHARGQERTACAPTKARAQACTTARTHERTHVRRTLVRRGRVFCLRGLWYIHHRSMP